MEVHHHPEVEKKGFKEYVLEGLMIFLAVMMGFFAESLREHISNKEKGHEFVVSLMADLKTDTAKMDVYLAKNVQHVADYKLLLTWLEQPIRDDPAFRSQFYKAALSTLGYSSVNFTDRIISQLKNSDNFRLIANLRVADAIMDYSIGTIACDRQREVVNYYTEEGLKQAMGMINFKAYKDRTFDGSKKLGDNTVGFIGTDQKILLAYSNSIYLKAGVEQNYTGDIKDQRQRAIKLIALLKKEYDLE